MPVVFIPKALRELTAGATEVIVEGASVGEVIDALETRFPGVRSQLCRGDSLAPGIQISVDERMTIRGLQTKLQPSSEVHFLPMIGGG